MISDSACDCGVPCEMHTYEPTMSYAQLSQFNIERMVLVDPAKRQRYAASLYFTVLVLYGTLFILIIIRLFCDVCGGNVSMVAAGLRRSSC